MTFLKVYNLLGGNFVETSELKNQIKLRLKENKERRLNKNDPLPKEMLEFDWRKAICSCSEDVIVIHCAEDNDEYFNYLQGLYSKIKDGTASEQERQIFDIEVAKNRI